MAGLILPQVSSNVLSADIFDLGINNDLAETVNGIYEGKSIEDAIFLYHSNANKTLNEFLERITDEDEPNVELVAYDEDCDENNISTFCLAVKLNEDLLHLELYLLTQKDSIDSSLLESTTTLDEAITVSAQNQEMIEREVEYAKDTLDLVLAVYNQVEVVLPVHKEFVELIKNLEEYRSNLATIRSSIELYPSKFNGATTLQCK